MPLTCALCRQRTQRTFQLREGIGQPQVCAECAERERALTPWLDTVTCGDCLDILPQIPSGSVDVVLTDPPYAEIDRPYGRLTEAEWWALVVEGVVPEVRRILKPTGSAVFIVQPNSRKVGSMRGWVFEFMAWVCREWNMVQGAWWWNTTALPTVHTHRGNGLLRPSLKASVWCGHSDCYRDQGAILRTMADETKAADLSDRTLKYRPSGYSMRNGRLSSVAQERGGSTPFNVSPIPGGGVETEGHSASTPLALCRWWTRYLCPPGGVLLDCFFGSGTTGVGVIEEGQGRHFIGIERDPGYCDIARRRIALAADPHLPEREAQAAAGQQTLTLEVS